MDGEESRGTAWRERNGRKLPRPDCGNSLNTSAACVCVSAADHQQQAHRAHQFRKPKRLRPTAPGAQSVPLALATCSSQMPGIRNRAVAQCQHKQSFAAAMACPNALACPPPPAPPCTYSKRLRTGAVSAFSCHLHAQEPTQPRFPAPPHLGLVMETNELRVSPPVSLDMLKSATCGQRNRKARAVERRDKHTLARVHVCTHMRTHTYASVPYGSFAVCCLNANKVHLKCAAWPTVEARHARAPSP